MTSVGDIIAIIDLVHKLGSLVNDSIYSPAAFRELIADLNSLSSALDNIHQLLSAPNPLPLEPSIANDINAALEQCETLMNDFVGRFKGKGYHDSFKVGGSGHLLLDSWRKVKWAYSMPSKVDSLKRNILEQKMTINTMFSASNRVALGHVQHTAQHNTELQLLHLKKLETIHVGIQQLQQLPRSLGYTWEGSDSTPVWFIDMRDVKIRLPMELCETWELFEGFLKIYFKNKVGQSYVERGDYDLTGEEGDNVILPTTWNSEIKAGVIINMDAILRLKSSDRRKCPSCGKSSSTITQSRSKTMCSFCHAIFRVSDKCVEGVATDRDTEQSLAVRDYGTSSPNDETCFLRRFHVIYTTILPRSSATQPTAYPNETELKSPQTRSPSQVAGDTTGTPSHPLNTVVMAPKTDHQRPSLAKLQVSTTQNSVPDRLSSLIKAPPPASQSQPFGAEDENGVRERRQRVEVPSLPKLLIPTDSSPSGCKVKVPPPHLKSGRYLTGVSASQGDVVGGRGDATKNQASMGPSFHRDPYIATQEWRSREEAGLLEDRGRRRRPRVIWGVAEDLSEDEEPLKRVRQRARFN